MGSRFMPRDNDFHPDLRTAARFLPATLVMSRTLPVVRALEWLLFRGDNAVEALTLASGGHVRLHRPPGTLGPTPAMLWIHGGGYVIGTPHEIDHVCRMFSRTLGITVAAPRTGSRPRRDLSCSTGFELPDARRPNRVEPRAADIDCGTDVVTASAGRRIWAVPIPTPPSRRAAPTSRGCPRRGSASAPPICSTTKTLPTPNVCAAQQCHVISRWRKGPFTASTASTQGHRCPGHTSTASARHCAPHSNSDPPAAGRC